MLWLNYFQKIYINEPQNLQLSSHDDSQNSNISSKTTAESVKVKKLDKSDESVWLLVSFGTSIVVSGEFVYWSNGLGHGIWVFLTAFIIVAIGYFCLTICMIEINSCIPFAGGSYGFIRIAVSPMLGYLVGFHDRLHAGFLFSRSLVMIGRIISVLAGMASETKWEPLYWLGILIVSIIAYLRYAKSKYSWEFIKTYMCFLIGIVIFFCISTVVGVNFTTYAYDRDSWVDRRDTSDTTGLKGLMRCIPMAMLFFDGMELIPSTASCTENPRVTIPRALFLTYSIAFCLGILLIFLVASHAPSMDTVSTSDMSLNMTWANSLGVSEVSTAILSLLPFIGSLIATMYSIEKFTDYMTKSNFNFGMLQPALQPMVNVNYSLFVWPYVLIYVIILVTYFAADNFIWTLCKLALLFAVVVQCSIFLTYYKLHGEYSTLKRQLSFSWGIYAAGVGVCFNLLVLIALFGYSSNMKFIGLCFLVLIFLAICNYIFYVVRIQKFSDEEEAILFVVHVMKANMTRNRKIRFQNRASADFSIRSGGSLNSSASLRKARQSSNAAITPMMKQRNRIYVSSEADSDDVGSKSSMKFETDSRIFTHEKPHIRVSQDPIRQSKVFDLGVFERPVFMNEHPQSTFDPPQEMSEDMSNKHIVSREVSQSNQLHEPNAIIEKPMQEVSPPPQESTDTISFTNIPQEKEMVIFSDFKATSIPTNVTNYFDLEQPTNVTAFVTRTSVLRSSPNTNHATRRSLRLSLFAQPQEDSSNKASRRNSLFSAWQNILPHSASHSFLNVVRSSITDTVHRLASSSVEIAAYGSAIAPEPYLEPEQSVIHEEGDIPRSESVAIDDVENARNIDSPMNENALLNDPNIAFLAYKVSKKNAFLHNHILHAGSIDDLDMNMVLDTLYDQQAGHHPRSNSFHPRSLQSRGGGPIGSSSSTAVTPTDTNTKSTNLPTE